MDINEIIDYLRTHRVTEAEWNRMISVIQEYERNMSKEEKHLELLEDIRSLDDLYKTDETFRVWCDGVLKIAQFREYIMEAERKSPFAKEDPYGDLPSEDYYIPCMTISNPEEGGSPFFWGAFEYMIYLVKTDWDDLICGEHHGTEAFAAFWHNKFNTQLMPEFFPTSDYPNESYEDPMCKNSNGFYFKRHFKFNLTIWDFEFLEEAYKEALGEKA